MMKAAIDEIVLENNKAKNLDNSSILKNKKPQRWLSRINNETARTRIYPQQLQSIGQVYRLNQYCFLSSIQDTRTDVLYSLQGHSNDEVARMEKSLRCSYGFQ